MADVMDRIQRWLQDMPELEILADIARMIGEPIRIRGGVPRNLLARALRAEGRRFVRRPRHLLDLVDPLSDIDLVVSTPDAIATVLTQVYGRLSLAGFTRWEGKVADQVARFEEHGFLTSLDRVEIEVRRDAVQLTRAEEALQEFRVQQLTCRIPAERRSGKSVQAIDRVLFAMRVARFAAEFNLTIDDAFIECIPRPGSGEERISRTDLLRVDLAALDVFLTAQTPEAARQWLGWMRDLIPAWVRNQSRVLIQLDEQATDRPARVIAYPRVGAHPPRVRLETDVPQNATLGNEPTLLPWTAIRVPSFGAGGCCPPADFSLGPLVIAWRGVKLLEERIGVVGLAPPADPYDAANRIVFGIPGVVTYTPAIVQRLDWGFARYLAGDNRLIYIGARPVIAPEPDR